jgi:hypothetical protein
MENFLQNMKNSSNLSDIFNNVHTNVANLTGGGPPPGGPPGAPPPPGGQPAAPNVESQISVAEGISCQMKSAITIIITIILVLIMILSLPVLPFIYISYLGFYGQFGIVKRMKDFSKSM